MKAAQDLQDLSGRPCPELIVWSQNQPKLAPVLTLGPGEMGPQVGWERQKQGLRWEPLEPMTHLLSLTAELNFKFLFKKYLFRIYCRDFPGGIVAKTPCSQFRGPQFNPGSGNYIPHATTKS